MTYYYLIAGLPDLEPDMDAKKIDFTEVVETIKRNLEPADLNQFRYLLYPRDQRNLLNTIWHKHKGFPELPHLFPSVINEEDIKDYRRQQSTFPSYMSEFLSINEGQFPNMSLQEMEDRLWEGFYEEILAQSDFIKSYFLFDKKLKEILAAFNASYYDFLSPPAAIDETILGQIGKGKSTTPALLRAHPYIEALGERMGSQRPDTLESFIHQIKWDFLYEIRDDFSREQVFAYTLKLLLVLDVHKRQPDQGISRFEELQKTIKSNVNVPIISAI